MPRLPQTAAALLILALAATGCSRNRERPTPLGPSGVSSMGGNSHLWGGA